MLAVISAMLGQLDEPTLVELVEALRLKLKPTPTAIERRVRELLPLAQLIKQLDGAKRGIHGTPLVERQLYDEQRPDEAPTSQSLVERYGSWIRACRAAEGTLADGRILRADGSTRPRTPGRRNETPVYTDAEIATAIRCCAIELGRRPSARASDGRFFGNDEHPRIHKALYTVAPDGTLNFDEQLFARGEDGRLHRARGLARGDC